MAATRIIPMHINKNRSMMQCLTDRISYAENGEKTEGGLHISSYACDPKTAEEEFMLSKKEYYRLTGRTPHGDIIAYQLRQSFKPGEITPEEANRIGYELAMKLTKGHHAFIVATHTDRAHIHNHIIWNSTDLDCTRKYVNIIRSHLIVEKISDRICLEHGLSVIDPLPRRERQKYTRYEKKKTLRSGICDDIDRAIGRNPKSFEEFLLFLEEMEYQIKKGKHIAVKGGGQIKFIRLDTLGEGYTQADLQMIFENPGTVENHERSERGFDMIIDIQKKIAEGKGKGYENWAMIYNIKQIADTLIFLKENGVRDYDDLVERTDQSSALFNELSERIKAAEKRLQEISELKKHIINYSKTREVYVAYRKSGYSKKFYEEHREEITLHKAAKEAFSNLPEEQKVDGKLPTVKQLSEEYSRVLTEKKKSYTEYRKAREDMKTYVMAKHNVDEFLAKAEKEQKHPRKKEKHISR